MLEGKSLSPGLAQNRLVVVSNRLPVTLRRDETGKWQFEPSVGGLVTALAPLLKERGGIWVGWPGHSEDAGMLESFDTVAHELGYGLKPVLLTKDEIDQYYFGFSNEIIWPLFHDLQSRCNFQPAYWNSYMAVNRKFARDLADTIRPGDYIWVHDYHLMLVGRELRNMGVQQKIGFFLHTPFPPLDIFIKLPWRTQILNALLEYDLLGFQTIRDRNNFLHCIIIMLKGFHVDARRQVSTVTTPKRDIKVGSFPIGIDFGEYWREAGSPAVTEAARKLQQAIPNQKMILGVDRMDYSKGIPEKLRGFRNALERFIDLHGRVILVQVVVPSREDIAEYQALKNEIEGLVGEINGKFSRVGWVPVQYIFRSLDRVELLAHYRAADIALVTSLKDGMNLVAKEYCAANVNRSGVLILSEFAGAADQFRRNSLLINPYDVEGVANAIFRAFNMTLEERRRRMKKLQKSVQKRDVFWWLNFYLQTASSSDIE